MLKHKLVGHTGWVYSTAISPKKGLLASGDSKGVIRVWRIDDGQLTHSFDSNQSEILCLEFSHSGSSLASGGGIKDPNVKVWEFLDAKEHVLRLTLTGHSPRVRSARFSPCDKRIVSSSEEDRKVIVWCAQSGLQRMCYTGHQRNVLCAAWSADGKHVASAGYGNEIHVWDYATSQLVMAPLKGHNDNIRDLVFGTTKKILVSASTDNTIVIWNLGDNSATLGHRLSGHSHTVRSVSMSPGDKSLVSASFDSTLQIWDVDTGVKIHTLEFHDDQLNSTVWSSDGLHIVSGGDDNTVCMDRRSKGLCYLCRSRLGFADLEHSNKGPTYKLCLCACVYVYVCM
jgi:WD40 repeat protein